MEVGHYGGLDHGMVAVGAGATTIVDQVNYASGSRRIKWIYVRNNGISDVWISIANNIPPVAGQGIRLKPDEIYEWDERGMTTSNIVGITSAGTSNVSWHTGK